MTFYAGKEIPLNNIESCIANAWSYAGETKLWFPDKLYDGAAKAHGTYESHTPTAWPMLTAETSSEEAQKANTVITSDKAIDWYKTIIVLLESDDAAIQK